MELIDWDAEERKPNGKGKARLDISYSKEEEDGARGEDEEGDNDDDGEDEAELAEDKELATLHSGVMVPSEVARLPQLDQVPSPKLLRIPLQ